MSGRLTRVARSYRQRLFADDGTVVQVEHLPAESGSRELAVVVAHGFMLSSRDRRLRQVAGWLREAGGVVLVDLRGHGSSGGVCTMGSQEVHDVEAAINWARLLGYRKVVTLGFSLGAAVVLRQAALHGGVDRVVAVSGPGQWYYRGTPRMRWLHRLVLTPSGRVAIRMLRRTRVTNTTWDEPLLVVHGDQDDLFPVEQAQRISAAAGDNGTLWLMPGFGHAEVAVDMALARQIGTWLQGREPVAVGPDEPEAAWHG